MLPDEMWEEVLMHLELSDLLRLKRVSKRWNEIISRVIKRACKWYQKCVAEIPEDMWSSMLNHQTHPKIRCENFHEAKIHSEIWMSMYTSWIGWNTLTEKSISIEDIEVFSEVKFLTNIFFAVTGNIIAVGSAGGQIFFYDISESTVNPIYEVNHGAPIGDVVLCRNGSDVMAVSYSVNDLRYWDLKTKKQIHQSEYRHPGRILSANFDYCYSLSCNEDIWILNVEQFVSGTVRSVRSATFTDAHYVFKAMGTDGDKAVLFMDSDGRGNKFYVNSPDNKFEALSVHEEVHGEARHMFLALNSCFKIFKPFVATYIRRRGKFLALSVNAQSWKTYDVKQDLCIDGSVSAILYHVGLLMMAIEFARLAEAEVRIYSIKNIDNLDNLDFRSMEFKTLKFTSPSITDLAATEYNSRQYLLAVGNRKIHVVKFD